MRMRPAVFALLLVACLAGVQGTAVGVPEDSGFQDTVTCGGASVTVLVSPGGGNKAWGVDTTGELDGTEYHLKAIDVRGYLGSFETEPIGVDPVFTFSHGFGKRKGQGSSFSCTDSETFTDEETGQTFSVFIDLEVVQTKP